MNQRLEQYLGEAEQKLQRLPETRRREELDEMRQHLTASVQAREEFGVAMEAATEEAIRQFGGIGQVSNGLQRVWWREQIGGPRGLWKTAALALALTYTVRGLLSPTSLLNAIPRPSTSNFLALDLFVLFLTMIVPAIIVGTILGRLTPRNAVLGAFIGKGLYVLHVALQLLLQGLIAHAYFTFVFAFSVQGALLELLIMVFAAWLTVRQQEKHLQAIH